MNIAFLMQDVGAMYGAERATLDLITQLKKAGETVHVLLINEERLGLGQSDLRDALAESGVSFVRLRTGGAFSPSLIRRIRNAAEESRANVVHTIGPKATFHGHFAIRGTRIRLVSTVHGWLFRRDPKERLYEWLERRILKRYDRVIVLSLYYRNYLLDSGFKADRVVHIASGLNSDSLVSVEEARSSLAAAQSFTIGMIGRLSAEKNHEMFLRAAKEIVGRGIKCRFVIAGLGPERTRIHGLVQRLGLEPFVQLCGYLPVDKFMRQIHVLVQCSRIENLPYSIMEAMAWCRPVVATNVGGLPDLIDEGKTGYLVPSEDHEALANRICEMSAWPRLVEEMGLAGRKKLESDFAIDRASRRHRELYISLLEPRMDTD
jgi:glycosyltransferase involved in cell wall biosynthesis